MSNKFKFTQKRLADLLIPDKGKRLAYYDTDMPGLMLQVYGSGTKTFYIYRRVQGKPERIKLGKFPDLTVMQAREVCQQRNGQIALGMSPAELRRDGRGELLFSELFSEYLNLHAKPHKRSWAEDERIYNTYLKPLQGKVLSNISRKQVTALHASVGANNGKPMANRVLALIKTLYNKADEWELYEGRNPARLVKRFPEQERERFLQADELACFFEAVAAESNAAIRDFILLALFTGVRRSSILAMRWDAVNFKRGEWFIKTSKNKKQQSVPLIEDAMTVLIERRKSAGDSPWVFPSKRSTTGHMVNPAKGWDRLRARSGLKDFNIHDLRRTLGSWQAKTGHSLLVIGKTLGHSTPQSTKIYARLDNDPVRAAINDAILAIKDVLK